MNTPHSSLLLIQEVRNFMTGLQAQIVSSLQQLENSESAQTTQFLHDSWENPEHGEYQLKGQGLSCLLENGQLFERAGVNFSHVQAARLPGTASSRRSDLAGHPFEAMGVSLVLHPLNPYCPTVHFNIRFLVVHTQQDNSSTPVWWFGGGMDLTPYYGFEEDAIHFHTVCKNAVSPLGADYYARFKKQCDHYFYLKHRLEPRGIGGIFFDDFSEKDFMHGFALIQSVGNSFLPAYVPIIKRRRHTPFGEEQRDWQCYRRGRYVEFNLVQDRGTQFGLQSGGRTEAILMSLPPVARWRYQFQPTSTSPEARLLTDFLIARDWIPLHSESGSD